MKISKQKKVNFRLYAMYYRQFLNPISRKIRLHVYSIM